MTIEDAALLSSSRGCAAAYAATARSGMRLNLGLWSEPLRGLVGHELAALICKN